MDNLGANPWFWLCYFALASGMGYWNYRKGHNFMIGVFISLLLTPIAGLLFNMFAKPNKEALRRRNAAPAKPLQCPSCGEMVTMNKKKCPNCGTRMKVGKTT